MFEWPCRVSPHSGPLDEPAGTSNIQHPTPNIQRTSELSSSSAFNVGCWMFSIGSGVQCANSFSGKSLPEGGGEGGTQRPNEQPPTTEMFPCPHAALPRVVRSGFLAVHERPRNLRSGKGRGGAHRKGQRGRSTHHRFANRRRAFGPGLLSRPRPRLANVARPHSRARPNVRAFA